MESRVERIDRYQGALVGLGSGEAVPKTLEFKAPSSFAPIDDIAGGGLGVLADPGLSERGDPADLIADLSALEVTFPPEIRVSQKCLLLASTIYKDFA